MVKGGRWGVELMCIEEGRGERIDGDGVKRRIT